MGNESLSTDGECLATQENSEPAFTLMAENLVVYHDPLAAGKIKTSESRLVDDDAPGNDESAKSSSDNNDANGFLVRYRGQRYNLQGFLKKHPGGSKIFKHYKGSNLDDAMRTNPHSEAAFHLFEEFRENNDESYQEIEKLVDWEKPLLSQVSSLGDRYWEWVNLPVNRSIRLFQSDFLERLTITPWYMVPICWIPISTFFLFRGYFCDVRGNFVDYLPQIFLALVWGFLLWTLIEYALHRKLFHMKPSPRYKLLVTLHFLLHGLHHKAPFDGQRLVFPPLPAMFLGVVFYQAYTAVFPPVMISFVTAGTILGYTFYDLTHYYLHYGAPTSESYMYVMKRYHNYHHFSHHEEGFGISSRLWDYVFGTMISLRTLKKAIEW